MSELDILKQLDELAAVTASFTVSAAAVISQQRRDLEQAATDISNLAERVSALEDWADDQKPPADPFDATVIAHPISFAGGQALSARHPHAPIVDEPRPPEVEP